MSQTFYLYRDILYRLDEVDEVCQWMSNHWMPISDQHPIRRGIAVTEYEAERHLVERASVEGTMQVGDSAMEALRVPAEECFPGV